MFYVVNRMVDHFLVVLYVTLGIKTGMRIRRTFVLCKQEGYRSGLTKDLPPGGYCVSAYTKATTRDELHRAIERSALVMHASDSEAVLRGMETMLVSDGPTDPEMIWNRSFLADPSREKSAQALRTLLIKIGCAPPDAAARRGDRARHAG